MDWRLPVSRTDLPCRGQRPNRGRRGRAALQRREDRGPGGGDSRDDRENRHHQGPDLHGAVRPLALYVPGSGVDHDMVDLSLKLVSANPYWQQKMQEKYSGVSGINAGDHLLIAANIAPDI